MGIDYTVNDARYLLTTLTAIINDKRPLSSFNRVNWNTVFRLANFHKIANVVYYAVLGSDEKISEEIRKGFYTAFNEALLGYERISKVQEALFWKLDVEGISTVVFRMANFNELYPLKEMGIPDALELYIINDSKEKIDELMATMDFTSSNMSSGDYVLYTRNPKCEVKVYFNNPFYDKHMKRYYDTVFPKLSFVENYRYVKGFDTDNYYIFLISMIANSYALKQARIRQLLDLWAFYKEYYEDFNWEYIQMCLEQIGIRDMANKLLELCFIWFDGATAENHDDLEIYDDMENYILSKGDIAFRKNCEYFPLVYNLNKLIIQEQERIEKEKYKKFLYPDAEYMQSLYPKLASNKIGLMLAYFIRRLRLFTSKKKANRDEVIEEIDVNKEFYEPQNEYPNDFFDDDDNGMETVKTAPLMVADDVQVMEDVLPVNTDHHVTGGSGSNKAGYISEEELMKENTEH